jgi:hypothetical protein
MRRERTHNTKVEPGFVKRRNRINDAFSRRPLSETSLLMLLRAVVAQSETGAGP